ncbi:hemagglutinin [Moraxella catarrhalis]|uniref:hemagglutinin n=2 Tax=Moraxella catarrhalis TaxID=480 RepID=UPI001F4DCF43|nr:hemagglutinin [Moraxella catarrhalis]
MSAIIGEMVGDWLVTEKLKQSIESGEIKLGSDEYNKLLNTIKITAGAILDIPYDDFQKASGSLHAGGLLGLIRYKTTGYTYGTHPRYGEIDYQYLRSKYGYDFKIKNGARNSTYKK